MNRVLTVAPMPPEKCAYALARYSRSPDSIKDSIEWVRTHDSKKFLESFYFQYGHASIADLGHLVICFEGVSELAATEIEDEQLWDGQARSSRYQDFSKGGFIRPAGLDEQQLAAYNAGGRRLLDAYATVHQGMIEQLRSQLPRPEAMKADAYERNIAARAFDVARYLLFFGIPTGVGQVTSIRTLERQIRRLKASPYGEIVDIGHEMTSACSESPACGLGDVAGDEPLAPTLAKYVDADTYSNRSREDLRLWAEQNLKLPAAPVIDMDLIRPADPLAEIAATLLYPATTHSFRSLYEEISGWGAARQSEVIDVALRAKGRRDELQREFRTGSFVYDIVMDIGAYRDLHRHRRCQQLRQEYTFDLGYSTPAALNGPAQAAYQAAMDDAQELWRKLPKYGRDYILPFGAKSRFLFKMDFAEVEYISKLRSGVKGHFSYRSIAWEIKKLMDKQFPELGRLIEATHPDVEDPLTR